LLHSSGRSFFEFAKCGDLAHPHKNSEENKVIRVLFSNQT